MWGQIKAFIYPYIPSCEGTLRKIKELYRPNERGGGYRQEVEL
jgi:hypothetical protein